MNEPRRTKAYVVVMSNKDPIKIDEEELYKVIEASAEGGLVVVKQGVINPSFIVDIQLDKDRMKEWQDQFRYGHGQGEEIRARGLEPLTRIYSQGTPIAKLLDEKKAQLEAQLPRQLPTGEK